VGIPKEFVASGCRSGTRGIESRYFLMYVYSVA
jgi:hypothetical protein